MRFILLSQHIRATSNYACLFLAAGLLKGAKVLSSSTSQSDCIVVVLCVGTYASYLAALL